MRRRVYGYNGTNLGGGTNIEDLTSGELTLISWLKRNRTESADGYFGSFSETFGDMSQISSVKVSVLRPYSDNYVYVFGKTVSQSSSSQVIEIPIGTANYISLDKNNNYVEGPTVKILSFTTTDGKVHTADNLNY